MLGRGAKPSQDVFEPGLRPEARQRVRTLWTPFCSTGMQTGESIALRGNMKVKSGMQGGWPPCWGAGQSPAKMILHRRLRRSARLHRALALVNVAFQGELTMKIAVISCALVLAGASLCLAESVVSLKVSTGTWNRASAAVHFGEGAIRVELVFEKEMPPRPKPKPGRLIYNPPAPAIVVGLEYGKSKGEGGDSLPELAGALESSRWEKPGPELFGREGTRVLVGHLGTARYRVSGKGNETVLAPFLKALLAEKKRNLYEVRRESPRQISVAGDFPRVVLYVDNRKKPNYLDMPHPGRMPDLEYETDTASEFILHFDLGEDDLLFQKDKVEVKSRPVSAKSLVLLQCREIQLQDNTDEKGRAEFDLGPQQLPGEWRYLAGGGRPLPVDWVMPVRGRVLLRLKGKDEPEPPSADPDFSVPESVAGEVASLLIRKYNSSEAEVELPRELTALLFLSRADRRSGLPWKGHSFWTRYARGVERGPAVDLEGWIDEQFGKLTDQWVREAAVGESGGSGWSEKQALRLLASLRLLELEPDRERFESVSRQIDDMIAALVGLSTPAGADGEHVAAHAVASLAFFKAFELFREPAYRRIGFEQAEHIMADHLDESTGQLLAGKKKRIGSLRTYGLAAQALERTWRTSSKPKYGKAVQSVKGYVAACWDREKGGFVAPRIDGKGKPAKAKLEDQFWALLTFSEIFLPYWGDEIENWLQ